MLQQHTERPLGLGWGLKIPGLVAVGAQIRPSFVLLDMSVLRDAEMSSLGLCHGRAVAGGAGVWSYRLSGRGGDCLAWWGFCVMHISVVCGAEPSVDRIDGCLATQAFCWRAVGFIHCGFGEFASLFCHGGAVTYGEGGLQIPCSLASGLQIRWSSSGAVWSEVWGCCCGTAAYGTAFGFGWGLQIPGSVVVGFQIRPSLVGRGWGHTGE